MNQGPQEMTVLWILVKRPVPAVAIARNAFLILSCPFKPALAPPATMGHFLHEIQTLPGIVRVAGTRAGPPWGPCRVLAESLPYQADWLGSSLPGPCTCWGRWDPLSLLLFLLLFRAGRSWVHLWLGSPQAPGSLGLTKSDPGPLRALPPGFWAVRISPGACPGPCPPGPAVLVMLQLHGRLWGCSWGAETAHSPRAQPTVSSAVRTGLRVPHGVSTEGY